MTARRVHVPAALHAELTEHTSLVRVLRTARTLDLTAHLLRSHDGDETWTQWPLIDCPVPEWSLADEIMQLGETVLRHHTPRDDERGLDSDSDLDGMAPTAANVLVRHTGAVLVHILALLADQRPSAPGSMQNRLWPMNWADVLALLAASGLVHPAYVLFFFVFCRARSQCDTQGRRTCGTASRVHLRAVQYTR